MKLLLLLLEKQKKISDVFASVSTVKLDKIEKNASFNATNLLENVVGVQVDRQGAKQNQHNTKRQS